MAFESVRWGDLVSADEAAEGFRRVVESAKSAAEALDALSAAIRRLGDEEDS